MKKDNSYDIVFNFKLELYEQYSIIRLVDNYIYKLRNINKWLIYKLQYLCYKTNVLNDYNAFCLSYIHKWNIWLSITWLKIPTRNIILNKGLISSLGLYVVSNRQNDSPEVQLWYLMIWNKKKAFIFVLINYKNIIKKYMFELHVEYIWRYKLIINEDKIERKPLCIIIYK